MVPALVPFVLTLGVGLAGGAAALAAGMAGGWLIGALFAVAGAALAGLPMVVPRQMRSIAMGFAGLTVGSAIDGPALTAAAGMLPASVAGLALTLGAMVVLSYLLHRRAFAASPATAIACAWPGHLLLAMAGAEALRADIERVALVQTLRLFVLVVLLPMAVGAHPEAAAAAAGADGADLAVAVLATALCTAFAMRRRIVGGEMFLSAALVGALVASGQLSVAVPAEANAFFQAVVGAYVGIGLARCRRATLAAGLRAALAAALLAAALTLAVALPMALLLDRPAAAVALAYAPGGGEAMILLAAAFGVDPGFVGIHHTLRLVALTFLFAPVLRRLAPGGYQATGSR